MHPFHAEIHARTELEARWRDAEQRRAVATPRWSDRAGALLVAIGERFDHAGRRLQGARPSPAAPCLEGCY